LPDSPIRLYFAEQACGSVTRQFDGKIRSRKMIV
jgi:hypothetical protein